MRLDLSICRLPVRGVRAVGGVRPGCRPNQPHNAMVPSLLALSRTVSLTTAARGPIIKVDEAVSRFLSTTTTAGLREAGSPAVSQLVQNSREHPSIHQN